MAKQGADANAGTHGANAHGAGQTVALQARLRGALGKGEFRRGADEALASLSAHALSYADQCFSKQALLAMAGGAFVTVGAILSVLLTEDLLSRGSENLLIGIGFAGGFSLVILTNAALFTEFNVAIPTVLFVFGVRRSARHVLPLWAIVFFGNVAGAMILASLTLASDALAKTDESHWVSIVGGKLRKADTDAAGWFSVLASGILGNWLVGIAAFVASTARTVPGKVLGIFFPVVSFSAIGFQHSPANMGYFFVALLHGYDTDDNRITWFNAIFWNLVPAAIGNMIGGGVLVSALFTHAYAPELEQSASEECISVVVADPARESKLVEMGTLHEGSPSSTGASKKQQLEV